MSDVLVAEKHEESGRRALIADEGDSVWLYVTEAGTEAIAADCWLYNRINSPSAAILKEQLAAYRARGLPPPAPSDLVKPDAARPRRPGTPDVRFTWSREDGGVAAWESGQLIGFIAPGHPRGFSRFLIAECPWGAPLDLELYEQLFPPAQG